MHLVLPSALLSSCLKSSCVFFFSSGHCASYAVHFTVASISVSLALSDMDIISSLDAGAHCCWCRAPFKPSAQGQVKVVKCNALLCGKVSHPGCANKGQCCNSPSLESVEVIERKKYPKKGSADVVRVAHGITSTAAAGNADLDTSFVLSSSAAVFAGQRATTTQPIACIIGGATTTVYNTVTTTVANSVASLSTTTAPTSYMVSPIASTSTVVNPPSSPSLVRPACDQEVKAIFDNAKSIDVTVLADAILALSRSSADTNSRIVTIEKDQKTFHANTQTYFARTAALEKKVESLETSSVAQNRMARDALATSRAAERGYVSDQVKIVGLPQSDTQTVQRAVKAVLANFGVFIELDTVTAVRPCPLASQPDPSGPEEAVSQALQPRSHDVFVTLKFAELRDILLRGFKDHAPVKLSDIDPSLRSSPGGDCIVKAFEVLAPDRYFLFIDVRRRARELGITKVWHSGGSMYARRQNGSRSIRVAKLDDLDRLRLD